MSYGVDDMALDNWCFVDSSTIEQKSISRVPTCIGFLNFSMAGYELPKIGMRLERLPK